MMLLAGAVVAIGLALIASSDPEFALLGSTVQGVLWGLVSGLLHALLNLLNRFHVRKIDILVLGIAQNATAAILLMPLAWNIPWTFGMDDLVYLAILGVGITAGAHVLLIHALKMVQAQVATLVAAGLEPIYAIIFAFLLLGELPEMLVLLGGLLIIGTTIAITMFHSDQSPEKSQKGQHV